MLLLSSCLAHYWYALQRDILGRLDCSPLWVRHGSCVRHWSARSFPEWSCTLGVVSNPSAGPVRGNGRCLLQAGRLPVLPTQPWFPLAVFPTSPGFETQLVQRVNDEALSLRPRDWTSPVDGSQVPIAAVSGVGLAALGTLPELHLVADGHWKYPTLCLCRFKVSWLYSIRHRWIYRTRQLDLASLPRRELA